MPRVPSRDSGMISARPACPSSRCSSSHRSRAAAHRPGCRTQPQPAARQQRQPVQRSRGQDAEMGLGGPRHRRVCEAFVQQLLRPRAPASGVALHTGALGARGDGRPGLRATPSDPARRRRPEPRTRPPPPAAAAPLPDAVWSDQPIREALIQDDRRDLVFDGLTASVPRSSFPAPRNRLRSAARNVARTHDPHDGVGRETLASPVARCSCRTPPVPGPCWTRAAPALRDEEEP
jgi:hypothetical protein